MNEIDEKSIQAGVTKKRELRESKRNKGMFSDLGKALEPFNLKDRWLLYVAVLISAGLTGASVFLILAGGLTDSWHIIFASTFTLIAITICEPGLLWWQNRLEYHQNNWQMLFSGAGLLASAIMTFRTVWSAGELLVWALGDSIFSNYTTISSMTQDWLVHFIPILTIIHIGLGLLYFATSDEASAKRSVERTRRASDVRIQTAKADMSADSAEAMADAMEALIRELAPRVGIQNARKAVDAFMLENGFDSNHDGKINSQEFAQFSQWTQKNPDQAKHIFNASDEQEQMVGLPNPERRNGNNHPSRQ